MAFSAITIIGLLAAAGTTSSFIPQVVKTLRSKETKDISLLMYVILCAGISLWLVYGLFLMDWPLILANTITLILAAPIMVMKIKNG
jgi:MtN3 and saliva related transmembrane protein